MLENQSVIDYTVEAMYQNVTVMSAVCVIPLMFACLAGWVSFQDPHDSQEELPQILAPIVGVVCVMLFFITAPWVIQLSLIVAALVVGKIYSQASYKIR